MASINRSTESFNGYQTGFLGRQVPLPALSEAQQEDLAQVEGTEDRIARYYNYSLQICASRRLPYYTAANIDGNCFVRADRVDRWRKDPRIDPGNQWGEELYRVRVKTFDKGHMTKREDVQWGATEKDAIRAADSTFYYTNAAPQHALLNRKIWASLENYILHVETTGNGLKVCVFTGPVLMRKDPFFVAKVRGESVQLSTLFWKVVVFPKKDGKLYRAGFLMSQANLLKQFRLVKEWVGKEAFTDQDRLFMEFAETDTYQVNIATIEKLTGLSLPAAIEPFHDDRKIRLILEEVDVKDRQKEALSLIDGEFRLQNILL